MGDPDLPPSSRGVVVLGVPIGSPEFVQHRLQELLARHGSLLEQLPVLEDVQVAWLDITSDCATSLSGSGYDVPEWSTLPGSDPPPPPAEEVGLEVSKGWQREASRAVDDFCRRALLSELDEALLDSQSSPYARIFFARPHLA